MSCDMTCNWLETCASKSVMRLVIFFNSCVSPAFPVRRGLPAASSPPSAPPAANSDSTRDSNFLNRSLTLASEASERFLSSDCSSRDSVLTTSEAYFLTSAKTCDRSAVEASLNVANMESESLSTVRNCSHSVPTSPARPSLPQAFARRLSTDSTCRCVSCIVLMRRLWLASMAAETKRTNGNSPVSAYRATLHNSPATNVA
mmetsp:Transcript_86867/g.202211  ORF Transcript_86867/g.202211 Transcript_86867/m.202211 type:complete len:202 (-) Transcript_86867:16-621(-)